MRLTRRVETLIETDRATIFDILADLRHYGDWLPHSLVFKGTTAISPGPIGVGTTYVETSPWGTRRGVVTVIDRPDRIAYWQPMTLSPRWLGTVFVRVEDSLAPVGFSTLLRRDLQLRFRGVVTLAAPIVARSFVSEIERIQKWLKSHAEARTAAAAVT